MRLGSVLGTTDARGCVVDHFGNEDVQSGRVAVRFLPSDTVEVNVIADVTYSDQQGPPDKYTVQLRTNAGVPPGVAATRSTTGTTTSRFRCSVPAGSSTAASKPPDKYTSYHRFGQDPLTGRITPNRNELTHTGLQVDIDWDISDNLHFKSTTAYRDFDNSFGRDSDGTPLPRNLHVGYVEARAVHAGVPAERPHGRERRRRVDDRTVLLRRVRLEPGLQQRLRVHVELLRSQRRAGPQRTTRCSRTSIGR